jgi:hypothetical protein
MNPLLEENLAEEHRRNITRELNSIRLQEEALKGKVLRPSLFTHIMQRLGQWLIVHGEKLVKRYEVPTNRTSTSSKQRYAH